MSANTDTQDTLLTHVQYAKLSLQEAMGKDVDRESKDLYLANAIFNLAAAVEELQPRPLDPPKEPKPTRKRVRVPDPAPKATFWQRLPLPAYYFVKASLLAMLQELSNTVRRA